MYVIGKQYSRNDIYNVLKIPTDRRGADWLNGYHRHKNDYYIFCNVGEPGRTGHDYPNRWEGPILTWHGKNKSHYGQTSVQNLISGEYRVLVFYRISNRDPFTFAGLGRPIPHSNTKDPVRIDWRFTSEKAVPVTAN